MDLVINNVTNLCNFMGKVVCVCVRVYLELLSHFLPIKINLTNILPILIKLVYFKNMAWATSFATRASRKFIYLPYRASGKKSYCHTLLDEAILRIHQMCYCLELCARFLPQSPQEHSSSPNTFLQIAFCKHSQLHRHIPCL